MPKEQGHLGEWVGRSASKNAKDRSNSATLRASQDGCHRSQCGMGAISCRMSQSESEKDSEKDSGYSEAGSDWVHTDQEDQGSSVIKPHWDSNKNLQAAGHNLPAYEEFTPVYVIKNLVVKPSRTEQLLQSPLTWDRGWHNLTGAKAPTQLLFIQQPAVPAPATSSSTLTPSSSQAKPQGQPNKGSSRSNKNHSSKSSYLPILNSYPCIAPHPRKDNHEQVKVATGAGELKESSSEGQSQSKRVCTEDEKREVVSTTSHLLKPQHHNPKEGRIHCQYKVKSSHNPFPNLPHSSTLSHATSSTHPKPHDNRQRSRSECTGSPCVSSSQMPSPPSSSDSLLSSSSSSSSSGSVAHGPYVPAAKHVGSSFSDSQSEVSSERQRRFLNTAEILSQSGLLAITLRTKELLRQNAATDKEITQLRQHTNLLCQAAQASQECSNDGANCLDKLLQAMTQSGSYPDLDLNQLKAFSNSHHQSKRGSEQERESSGKSNKACYNPPRNLVALHNIDDGTSPPSPLFAPSPEADTTGQDDSLLNPLSLSSCLPSLVLHNRHRQSDMDKVLVDLTMSPESSTLKSFLL